MRILNINTSDKFNVFFSSDWHLNHRGPRSGIPLWQSRGYQSPEEMTEKIILKINELVMPDDYIFYAGDFCLDTTEEKFERDLSRINCKNIFMIWGNHNSPTHRIYKREIRNLTKGLLSGDIRHPIDKMNEVDDRWDGDIEVYPFRYKNVVFCGDYLEVIVDEQYICMCHYPMDVFNKMRHDAYMLCGHSHYTYDKTRHTNLENKRLDLSWDGHHKPLSISEIKQIMKKKNLIALDHHGRE